MKVKEESEKAGLKHNIKKEKKDHAFQSNHFMQIHGKTMEKLTDFIFLGSKITAYCDCCHEIKIHLLLRRKVMTNLGSILKRRETLLCKQSSV